MKHVLLNTRNWWLALIGAWIVHFAVTGTLGMYYQDILVYAGINIILAVSLNLVSGITGMFSIGHAGFMSVGGYTAAWLTITLQPLVERWFPGAQGQYVQYLMFLACLYAGGLAASLTGLLVGLPTLRLRGDYLAIVTLGMGEIIRVIILNIDAVGGARGLPGIPQFTNFGLVFSVVILCLFAIWRLIYSSHGRSFISVREDEIAAEAMGVSPTRTKVQAFVLGSFWAGIAGGLFAHYLRYLSPQSFDFNRSFEIIIMVVLGGLGSLSGSVVAAVILTILPEALRPLQEITGVDLRMVIYSLMLILLMLTRPHGLFGKRELIEIFEKRRRPISSGGIR